MRTLGQVDKINFSDTVRMTYADRRADMCSTCGEIWLRWTSYLDLPVHMQTKEKFRKLFNEEADHMTLVHGQPARPPTPKHHTGNGKPKGIFAGTLTMSTSDPYNQNDMIAAARKIFSQTTCPVKRYAWYLEYTDAGTPHIHFLYECDEGGRIHAKIFKRYWKIWDERQRVGKGHRGGYHSSVQSETAYKEYIEKDGSIHCENKWATD